MPSHGALCLMGRFAYNGGCQREPPPCCVEATIVSRASSKTCALEADTCGQIRGGQAGQSRRLGIAFFAAIRTTSLSSAWEPTCWRALRQDSSFL